MVNKASNLIYKYRRWLPLLFTLISFITLFLTLVPADSLSDSTIWDYDKLGHAAVFGGWTFVLGLLFIFHDRLNEQRWANIVMAFWIGILFGGMVEVLQYFLPLKRKAELLDFLADVIGSLVALGFLRWIKVTVSKQ